MKDEGVPGLKNGLRGLENVLAADDAFHEALLSFPRVTCQFPPLKASARGGDIQRQHNGERRQLIRELRHTAVKSPQRQNRKTFPEMDAES